MKKLVNVTLMFCVLSGMSACTTLNGDPIERADRQAKALAPRTPKIQFDEAIKIYDQLIKDNSFLFFPPIIIA